jgi:hypothetical protein
MLDNIDYNTRLESPTIDHYRLDWAPNPSVKLGGMWVPGIVTDISGQSYLGLRGLSDFIPGMTHTVSPFCGFRALQKNLVDDPPHLYPEYSGHDWYEPFQFQDNGDALEISYYSGRVVRDVNGLHWYDADGRWELHGQTVSKIFILHVPRQDGIDHEVYYRHELLKAGGTVSGTTVQGYLHQDFCYGPPGLTYTRLPIARQLEGMWVSWIHEFSDGEIGGGCFWQGRGGLDFGPGYILDGGETSTHDDFKADLKLNEFGRPTAMRVDVSGKFYEFALESVAGPLHSMGTLVRSSADKATARSWCWIEYAETMLSAEILDLMNAQFELVWAR